jgi:hypothetical protein
MREKSRLEVTHSSATTHRVALEYVLCMVSHLTPMEFIRGV